MLLDRISVFVDDGVGLSVGVLWWSGVLLCEIWSQHNNHEKQAKVELLHHAEKRLIQATGPFARSFDGLT